MDSHAVAASVGLSPSQFSIADWTRIQNAITKAYSTGFGEGYTFALAALVNP